MDKICAGPPKLICPGPGDIMLATDDNFFWKITHDLALAFEPHGSGIFFHRPDGQLAILEAGPNDTLFIRAIDPCPTSGICRQGSRLGPQTPRAVDARAVMPR